MTCGRAQRLPRRSAQHGWLPSLPWLLRSSLLLPLLSSLRCSQLSSQRLPVVARLARPPFASRVAAPTARRPWPDAASAPAPLSHVRGCGVGACRELLLPWSCSARSVIAQIARGAMIA
jgi:hypothetical protein